MSTPNAETFRALQNKDELLRWAEKLINKLNDDIRMLAFPNAAITLVNGANANVKIPEIAMLVHVVGPTGAFDISGFAGTRSGRYMVVVNTTAFVMTIDNENVGSAANNRITTFGGNIAASIVTMVYSTKQSRWLVTSAR